MKTLMFGWELPPHNSGGLGVACAGLARALSREGVEVSFVLPRRIKAAAPWGNLIFADERTYDDETTAVLARLHSGYITNEEFEAIKRKYPELAHVLSGSLLDEVIAYGVRARRVARTEPHDVIHVHDWLSVLAGIEARAVSGKPLVVHIHATEIDRCGIDATNNDIYAIERLGAHAADRVIAVSNYTKQMLVRHYGVPEEKIEVVHNGIDPDDTVVVQSAEEIMHEMQARGKKIVLFAGRITLQKGPDYFIRAAKRVLEVRPDTVFLISGSGDMERQIIQEAAYHGIGDKVLFLGFVRGEALARLYRMSDVFVMPSVSEPFGIVPLEALANGTPVIVSKQSGVSEVLRHALKVDFWDVDDIAGKIIAVLDHDSLRNTLREQGMKEVVTLVWKKAAEKCASIYQTVVQSLQGRAWEEPRVRH